MEKTRFWVWFDSTFLRSAKRAKWLDDEHVLYAVIKIPRTNNPLSLEAELEFWAHERWDYHSSENVLAYTCLDAQFGAETYLLAQTTKKAITQLHIESKRHEVLWRPKPIVSDEESVTAASEERVDDPILPTAQAVLSFYPNYLDRRRQANQQFYAFLLLTFVFIFGWSQFAQNYFETTANQLHDQLVHLESVKSTLLLEVSKNTNQKKLEHSHYEKAQFLDTHLYQLLSAFSHPRASVNSLSFNGSEFELNGEVQNLEVLSQLSLVLPSVQAEVVAIASARESPPLADSLGSIQVVNDGETKPANVGENGTLHNVKVVWSP